MPYFVLNLDKALALSNKRREAVGLPKIKGAHELATMLNEIDADAYEVKNTYQQIRMASTRGVRSMPEHTIANIIDILIVTRAELVKYDLK